MEAQNGFSIDDDDGNRGHMNTHSSSHSRGHQFSKDDKTDGRQGMTYVQLYTVLIDSGVVGMPQCTFTPQAERQEKQLG